MSTKLQRKNKLQWKFKIPHKQKGEIIINSKWHLYISIAKSIIRILSCLISLVSGKFEYLAIGLGIAEGLGILEELKDER